MPFEGSILEINEVLTMQVFDDVFLRLYPDSRPLNLEIANLQKGLVLLFKSRELIEEGIGFGAPVVIYEDNVFFSNSAKISTCKKDGHVSVSKSFIIDTISRKRIWKGPFINERLYSLVHRFFAKLYRRNKGLKPLLVQILELTGLCGLNTHFVKVTPRGNITFVYTLLPDGIQIEVDFKGLDKKKCKEILVMNEQGPTYFSKYTDSGGLCFVGDKLGAWEKVEANHASLSDPYGRLSFSLKNMRGAALYRGREHIGKSFSWVGLSYTLNPRCSDFSYKIWIRENRFD